MILLILIPPLCCKTADAALAQWWIIRLAGGTSQFGSRPRQFLSDSFCYYFTTVYCTTTSLSVLF